MPLDIDKYAVTSPDPTFQCRGCTECTPGAAVRQYLLWKYYVNLVFIGFQTSDNQTIQ